MNKLFLRISRYIISRLPKGKSLAIRIALYLFGNKFDGVITAVDGRKFYMNNISLVKRQLFFVNEYEDYETKLIQKIVRAGDYTLDVGASFGWYTTLMSKIVGTSGKVFAFELAPNIAQECKKNIELNNMQDNIILEDTALGDTEGVVDFIYSEDLGLGNLNPKGLTGGGLLKTGKGKITTFDRYIEKNNIPKINFIKCDIDGAEVLFLKGARRTLSVYRPFILIEASGSHGRNSCYEIFNEINQFGYKFFSLHYKTRLKPIPEHEFKRNFKENILCLPSDRLSVLSVLTKDMQ